MIKIAIAMIMAVSAVLSFKSERIENNDMDVMTCISFEYSGIWDDSGEFGGDGFDIFIGQDGGDIDMSEW